MGTKRIGVAVSDTGRTMAVPVTVLKRSADWQADVRGVVELVEEYQVGAVVVGLPLSHSGGISGQAQLILDELGALAESCSADIYLWDERYSSALAERRQRETGMNSRKMRGRLDSSAAAVVLEDWLGSGGQAFRLDFREMRSKGEI